MPNTPAAVRQGITVATTAKGVTAAEKKRCHELLEAVGQVLWVDDEALIDPVTALSGSGPAYVFLLVEAMAAAGAKLGLSPDMAMQLARATVAGSGELLRQSSEPASQLRVNVTSPGRHDGRGAESVDGSGRHPAGVRQGAGGSVAPIEGTRRMTDIRRRSRRLPQPGCREGLWRGDVARCGRGGRLGPRRSLSRLSRQDGAGVRPSWRGSTPRCWPARPAADRSRGDGARPAVRCPDAPLRRAASASRGAGRDPPCRHARSADGAGDGPGAAPLHGGHAGGRLGAERRPSVVHCGRMACWRSTMPFPGSTIATTRPICPRPWPPWTAASKWRRDGHNSLINIQNLRTSPEPAPSENSPAP